MYRFLGGVSPLAHSLTLVVYTYRIAQLSQVFISTVGSHFAFVLNRSLDGLSARMGRAHSLDSFSSLWARPI